MATKPSFIRHELVVEFATQIQNTALRKCYVTLVYTCCFERTQDR